MFPSMDDWLDEMPAGIIDQEGNWLEPVEVLANFLRLIYETPNLDWLLLTKRAEQCRQRLEAVLDIKEEMGEGIMGWPLMVAGWLGLYGIVVEPPDNVWFGVSVENQETAEERIPELLKIPARVRFLSVEPLLGPVVFDYCDEPGANHTSDWSAKVLPSGIHWVIVGGESGPKARPCKVEWVRDIVRQCKAADVPCFVKQLGSDPLSDDARDKCLVEIRDRKGGEPGEWPEDLRIREMPLNR
jgi:protein gp37